MAKVIKAAVMAVVVAFVTVVAITYLSSIGIGAGIAGGIGGATAITMYATAFVGTLVAGGIGMLSNKGISASAGNFGTKVTRLGGAVARQIIYGTARVGGTFVKMDTRGTKNSILSTVIVVAGMSVMALMRCILGKLSLHFLQQQ